MSGFVGSKVWGALLALVLLGCGGRAGESDAEGLEANGPRVVTFSVDATSTTFPQTLTYRLMGASRSGTVICRLDPNNDGIVDFETPCATEKTFKLPITAPGAFRSKLTVVDGTGASAEATLDVSPGGNAVPPTITTFTASATQAQVGDEVVITARASDPKGGALTCRVELFLDGRSTDVLDAGDCTTPFEIAGSFNNPGTVGATLTATDAQGLAATAELTIDVTAGTVPPATPPPANGGNRQPLLTVGAPLRTTATSATVTFSWTASDPDGDAIHCLLVVKGSLNQARELPGCGVGGQGSESFTTARPGTLTIEMTVTDARGATAFRTNTQNF